MNRLTISLLGPFRVTLDGEPLTRFGADTARALLAYLAMHPGVEHRRSVLAALLWPEQPDAEALRNLRVALSRLRDAIGDRDAQPPYLLVTRQTIQLSPEADWRLDAGAFREAIAATRAHEHASLEACAVCAERLAEAADLYGGEFLAGFAPALRSVPFEEWMVVEREDLHWQALEALHALALYHEEQGAYEQAIRCARRQVELEPWREVAHRQWMRALALSGRRGAALAQYEACRRILAEELGVEPEATTATLYEQVRTGALAPVQVTPSVRDKRREVAPPEAIPDAIEPLTSQEPSAILAPEQRAALPVTSQPAPVGEIEGVLEGERRVVTALVADVKDSTVLAEQIGTEAWVEIMDHVFQLLGVEVYRYGGEIDQYRGDGLVAFFGLHTAHEDDPERAVLAALAMQEAVKRYARDLAEGDSVGPGRPVSLSMRIGVNTGEVIATSVGDQRHHREQTAMGQAIAIAARMETSAVPGTVLVTQSTFRQAQHGFEWQALGEIAVKGVSQPVAVYRPLARRAVAGKGRGIEGLASPLVGRDAEFSALQEAVARLRTGVGGIVTVVGDAGIGKSRLVAEIRNTQYGRFAQSTDAPRVADGVQWVEGRCLSYATGIAYSLWLNVLPGLLGLAADALPEAAARTLRERVYALCPDCRDEVYPFLARMMSLPVTGSAEDRLRGVEGEGLQVLTFRAIETLIERAAQREPLVIVCEDLHWADLTSLALLEQSLPLTDRVPLLFVCVLRSQREHACWRIREVAVRSYPHRHVDVQLSPLSRAEGESLLENLLLSLPAPDGRMPVGGLPAALKTQVLGRAEGNPFYVEEIVRGLIRSGAIVCDEASCQWQAGREAADLSIPETLYGVLRARIDHLPAGARRVLQLASVVGRVFSFRLLAEIAAQSELHAHLVTLQREQMIRERARMPEAEYIFEHQLTLEAAYGGLLGRARRALHRRVAEALERLYPERVEEQMGLLARHWEQAGETGRAVDYLRRAGEQAAAQYANKEAVGYLSRALDLMSEDDLAARYDVLSRREALYHLQGAREDQREDVSQLQGIADALAQRDDGPEATRRLAEVALREARFYQLTTVDLTVLADTAQRAVCLGRTLGEAGIEAEGHLRWGNAINFARDTDGAWAHWKQSLAIARAAGCQHQEALALRQMGISCLFMGQFDTARTYFERNLAIHREIGNRMEEGKALNALADLFFSLHDLVEAKAYTEEGLRLCRLAGNRFDEAYGLSTLGETLAELGMYAAGDVYLQEAIRLFRQVGHPHGESVATADRAWVARIMGDDDASLTHSERALCLADATNSPIVRTNAWTVRGDALTLKARWSDARDAYQEALTLCQGQDWPHWAVSAQAGLARIALSRGELGEAQAHAQEILRHVEVDPKLCGTRGPMRVYLTCYRVLQAVEDPRAEHVLYAAYRLLQEWAAKIEDEELRRSYLENVPSNREIVVEYARHSGVTPQ